MVFYYKESSDAKRNLYGPTPREKLRQRVREEKPIAPTPPKFRGEVYG
jgi:hypothetical protein